MIGSYIFVEVMTLADVVLICVSDCMKKKEMKNIIF